MNKLPLLIFCLIFWTKTSAQFGNTAQVISRSTAASLAVVSATDVDGDGDNDVLATHQNSLVFYENLDGKGNFSSDRELMELEFATFTQFLFGAQSADLDGDGLPDVACDRFWRKNLGGGNFAPRATVFASSLATLCDVDGDNLPDAINLDNAKIYWQRNLGASSFAARQIIKNAPTPNIWGAKDLNFDGKMDFIARHGGGTFWYKNLGTNQFDTVRLSNAQHQNLEFLDFDADGKMDFFTTNGKSVFWYEIEANETVTLVQTVTTTQFEGGGLALGDMDADGDLDIFMGNAAFNLIKRAGYFPFDAATGKFVSTTITHNIYSYQHGWCSFTNFDDDGQPDILVPLATSFGWLKKVSPTQFSGISHIFQELKIPTEILSGDLENDGDMDIFTSGYVFRNLGNGQYAEKQKSTESGSRTFRGDLDGDGQKDLARPFGDSISWRKNLGGGQFSGPILLPGLVTSCKEIGGGDLDADGDIDLFAANGSNTVAANARFYWFENDGKGNFTGHLLATDFQYCSGAFALDVNEDGRLDMVLSFFNGNGTNWYANLGGGNFGPPQPLFQNTPSPSNVNQKMLTDFDGDGRIDFLYSTKDWSLTKVAWFRNLGNSTFAPEVTLVQMAHQGSWSTPYFTVFDATQDGWPDLIVSDCYWSRIHLRASKGNGKFAPDAVVFDLGFSYGDFYAIAPHDVDGDGRLDVVFGNLKRENFSDQYNQLSWLRNLYPPSKLPFVLTQQTTTCSDNQTPADATDDSLTFSLKVKGLDNSSNRFTVADFITGALIDTFFYDQMATFSLPPGSAGAGSYLIFEIRDLIFRDTFSLFAYDNQKSCSTDAKPTIKVSDFTFECHENGTPDDPTDDRVFFWLSAKLYNAATSSVGFYLTCNLGTVVDTFGSPSNFGYYQWNNLFLLPEGSANAGGQVVLTLRDEVDTSVVHQIVFQNPCAPAVAPGIKVTNFQSTCHDNDTPNDPTDDRVGFWITADFVGQTPPSDKYHLQSFFAQLGNGDLSRICNYGQPTYLEFKPGSAATAGEIMLDLQDSKEYDKYFMVHRFQSPGPCSGTPPVCPRSVQLNRQAEIDSFSINYPGCKVIEGFLMLDQNKYLGEPTIENLHGLRQIEAVHGDVLIKRTNLKNLIGLDSLRLVGNDLTIVFDKSRDLETFAGLGGLRKVGHLFWITGAFPGVPKLKNLEGLENLDTIGSGLILWFLNGIKNLEGLSSLKHGGIEAVGCDSLINLTGIENMESAFSISMYNNKSLESLDGLQGLKTIATDTTSGLYLFENPNLHDLSALNRPVPMNVLYIEDNPKLSACSVEAICRYLMNPPADSIWTSISENLPDCNSPAEVLAKCTSATVDFSQTFDFQVFPNPVSGGEDLKIELNGNFSGEVKIEILSLDGRVLQTVFREKTRTETSEIFKISEVWPSQFIVRVSDGKASEARLILKF